MSAVMTPARLMRGVRLRYRVLRHRGGSVVCPVCGHGFSSFRDDWNRPNAICWRCGSHERHRLLWLYLEHHPQLLAGARSLLHFAPEWCLEQRLRRLAGVRYVTADLDPAKGELQLDITNLALADASFDAILCSHVLEHVEADRAAMRELFRVLTPGGWAIVMVPLDLGSDTTYEDPAVRTPSGREQAFLQWDHVRLYAPDIADRLGEAGFDVEREQFALALGSELAARYGCIAADEIYLCRKPSDGSPSSPH
jgi:SAM-dependent methyltransferase